MVVVILAWAVGVNGQEATGAFDVHDMLAMERISDWQVSPDGAWIVFVLRTTDLAGNKGLTDLWVVNNDGKQLSQLTSSPAGDFNPRWSADGRSVWFISTRSGSSQVWQIAVDGGEAQQVTDLPLEVGNLVVSPRGGHIAFTMEVFVDCDSVQATRKRLDDIAASPATGKIYDRLMIRHWDTWKDGRRAHLFVRSVDGSVKGNNIVDVMAGMDADTPSKPFGGPEEITFSPDGRHILFSARDAGRDEAWSTNFDLYRARVDGAGTPENLTADNKAWDTQPVFSPDGKTLAYLAMQVPNYESDRWRIVLMDWKTGKKRVLTEAWDRSPGGLCFSPDSNMIYTTANNLGQSSLFEIRVDSGKAKTVVYEGWIGSPRVMANPEMKSSSQYRLLYGMDNLQSPVELYSVTPSGKSIQAVTRINAKKAARAKMGAYEQFTFKGWNNETVYGYLVKPADFKPGKKYPVAFLIHGGPQGSFGNHFHYRWNPQAYAGAGYAAVMIDFHGSTGYGQEFTDSIQGDWGGKPLEDLQKGLAAALEQYAWLDGDRVGALGASFGGYMINWIEGNWPDRFRCLINHDGNLDERMAYYDTEELWFPERDHQGTPWDNPRGYEKHNPVNFVKNWKTPMLVIHGGQDFRVVETQGMATFTALQRRGIPSKFLYFPDENHWVLKPHNSILWHETVIKWLDQWVVTKN
ncbi:MAG: S9 family peptidase [Phycisphaerae bacterium]|nr:S9 family peptidase [Phycisphaerae bacterium]